MKLLNNITLFLFIFSTHQSLCNELSFLQQLQNYLNLSDHCLSELQEHITTLDQPMQYFLPTSHLPIFTKYPTLKDHLPHITLGHFPTPIQQLEFLGKHYGIPHLFIKQDGLSGTILKNNEQLFGGNKVRKLEFLLADALQKGAKTILTFGCVGSNHAVATAAYAQHLGLKCITMLKPQPNSYIVRKNLLLMHHYDAQQIMSKDNETRSQNTIQAYVNNKKEYGDYPYPIPTGGSCPLGVIGFVNAAFELKEQINKGELPEPDYIYVPAGSMGTAAGLLLGAKAAGLKAQIVAVAVEPEEESNYFSKGILQLCYETNKFLHELDANFPLFSYTQDDLHIVLDAHGKQYGLFTQKAIEAMQTIKKLENVGLDGTYTGKAFAGLLHDINTRMLHNKNILFWNTFCGENFAPIINAINYLSLPAPLHTFFVQDVQELDSTYE